MAWSFREYASMLHPLPFLFPTSSTTTPLTPPLPPDIRIRVSASDLAFYNLTSLPLRDGSGYAAELGVHHELHCLKKIRHYIHRDYYLVNETEAEIVEWAAHIGTNNSVPYSHILALPLLKRNHLYNVFCACVRIKSS